MFERERLVLGIAAKHLAKRRRQTAVAIAGVAIGVGFFLAVSAMMIGSQNDFIQRIINAAPHIIISDEIRSPPPQPAVRALAGTTVEVHGYKTRNEVRGIKDWQEVARAASEIPGSIVAPSLSGAITLRVGGREEPLGIVGVDPAVEQKIANVQENMSAGSLHNLETTQDGVIVGEDLAQELGVRMGDTVGATSRAGTRSLKIVGLFARGRGQFGNNGYVLLREAQSLTAQPFIINRIGVSIPDPYQAEAVAADLEGRFGYKAQSWQERSADFMTLLLTRNVIMYSVVSAILLVASFGIYTAVSNSVVDKRRDIAILRSIGFSESDLQRTFVAEGLILALVGVLAGWGLGFLLMEVLGSIKFPILGRVEHLPLDRSARQFAIASFASLTAATIAAWLPARKAARVDPVEILRGAA
ncbi:MAG TPA: ABC transporter permease [Sphingomicrobium sp.]|nr:ABC transporter permease [Sphingomicrobium sp.]